MSEVRQLGKAGKFIRRKLISTALDAYEMPDFTLPGLQARGNREICIEGCKGILEYEQGKIKLNWRGELWFDGAYMLKLELVPEGIASIDDFGFDYAVDPEFGRYAMTPCLIKWNQNKAAVQLDLLR